MTTLQGTFKMAVVKRTPRLIIPLSRILTGSSGAGNLTKAPVSLTTGMQFLKPNATPNE